MLAQTLVAVQYPPLTDFLRDCLALSSGVLATLTGQNRYDVLEPIYQDWIAWVTSEPPGRYRIWQEAWRAYDEIRHRR